jgi:glutamate-5-semialdehyde dehydrogenase
MRTIQDKIQDICRQARAAAAELRTLPGQVRSQALAAMPAALEASRAAVREANEADTEAARQAGMPEHLIKRLVIDDKIFAYMASRLKKLAALPDPVGRVLEGHTRPDGLKVEKVTVPIGVIGIIYESRPNVTTDAAAVCLKSGNAVILRGGAEALRTNLVLADAMNRAAIENGIPVGSIQIVDTADREAVGVLLEQKDTIDVLIPRGGKSLIKRISESSRIPVIKHYDGICHLYIAGDAPVDMAVDLTVNSKCQRVEVCNALETLLIDAESAARMLPPLIDALRSREVEIRGCERCRALVPNLVPASEEDWRTEYLAPILAVRIVDGVEQAIEHIATYGSGHTDGIVTQSLELADRFTNAVDSSSVLVNCSTRLSGGGDYGLGAVVGISTDKLHARGPVGADELTSYKWIARGKGHLRA